MAIVVSPARRKNNCYNPYVISRRYKKNEAKQHFFALAGSILVA